MAEGQPRNAGKFAKRDAELNGINGAASGETHGSNSGNSLPVVNPAEIGETAGGKTADREPGRRGRPRKDGGKANSFPGQAQEKTKTLDVAFLNRLLFGIHEGLATLTKIPELAIDESESKMLAESAKQLMEVYEIKYTDKQEAWFHFYSALVSVYGTRVAILFMKKRKPAIVQPAPKEENPVNAGFSQV